MRSEHTLDQTLLALADPVRRAILARLEGGEARVTDVAAPFDISLPAVSKHIRQLERAGLVKRRRAGREHLLSVDPAPLALAAGWLAERRAFWSRRLDSLATALGEDDEGDDRDE